MTSRGSRSIPYPSMPTVPLKECPIATTLGTLGRKWTLTILRDVAFFPQAGFALIRRRNRGLRQRTLSLRLRQLAEEGLVKRVVPPNDPRHPYYELTEKGLEVWPILAALFQFGIRNHAPVVFEDARPRDLSDVYPHDAALMLGTLREFARTTGTSASPTGTAGTTASAMGRSVPSRR